MRGVLAALFAALPLAAFAETTPPFDAPPWQQRAAGGLVHADSGVICPEGMYTLRLISAKQRVPGAPPACRYARGNTVLTLEVEPIAADAAFDPWFSDREAGFAEKLDIRVDRGTSDFCTGKLREKLGDGVEGTGCALVHDTAMTGVTAASQAGGWRLGIVFLTLGTGEQRAIEMMKIAIDLLARQHAAIARQE